MCDLIGQFVCSKHHFCFQKNGRWTFRQYQDKFNYTLCPHTACGVSAAVHQTSCGEIEQKQISNGKEIAWWNCWTLWPNAEFFKIQKKPVVSGPQGDSPSLLQTLQLQ